MTCVSFLCISCKPSICGTLRICFFRPILNYPFLVSFFTDACIVRSLAPKRGLYGCNGQLLTGQFSISALWKDVQSKHLARIAAGRHLPEYAFLKVNRIVSGIVDKLHCLFIPFPFWLILGVPVPVLAITNLFIQGQKPLYQPFRHSIIPSVARPAYRLSIYP